MSNEDFTGAPLDIATLEGLAQWANTHHLVDRWTFQPDPLSPRLLSLDIDADQYPTAVDAVRLDVRWFEGGDYTLHYLESRDDDVWQCQWDRHPKPGEPRAHFHPPPDAGSVTEPSNPPSEHHLEVLFAIFDWITNRIKDLHDA